MTSPVSPLATVKELLAQGVLEQDAFDENVAIRIPIKEYREALAVLDSLDGTITLTVEEAEKLRGAVLRDPIEKLMHENLALLAARIEESK